MTAQEYIIASFQKLSTPDPHEVPSNQDLEAAIFAKVMSKKFRKLKAGDDVIAITKQAIHTSVKNQTPIIVNIIFGGNKLWRLEEAPEIDWAELFTTRYLLRWMTSIASVYKPGARLEYFSEDVVLETMNNLPRSETDRYSDTFKAMLEWVRPYLPPNVSVMYRRYGEEYNDISEYLAELEIAKAKVLSEHGGKLPELSEAQRVATELNVRVSDQQLADPLWRERVELIHQSIERTSTMERYINDYSMIPACPTRFPGCICTGSTKKSYAKFWVGVGALEKSNDSFNDLILTPSQLESAQYSWENVQLEGLNGKNFNRIRILG